MHILLLNEKKTIDCIDNEQFFNKIAIFVNYFLPNK